MHRCTATKSVNQAFTSTDQTLHESLLQLYQVNTEDNCCLHSKCYEMLSSIQLIINIDVVLWHYCCHIAVEIVGNRIVLLYILQVIYWTDIVYVVIIPNWKMAGLPALGMHIYIYIYIYITLHMCIHMWCTTHYLTIKMRKGIVS